MLRTFIVLLMLTLPAAPAHADVKSVRDAVVRELREDGYSSIRMSRTLLGRLRFTAERPGSRREIVVSPTTGVILRDYLRRLDGGEDNGLKGSGSGGLGSGDGSGGGGAFDDEDDDADDDDNDDEDADDNDDDEDDEDDDNDDDEDDEN